MKNRKLIFILLLLACGIVLSMSVFTVFTDSEKEKLQTTKQYVFLGDSLTDYFDLEDSFPDLPVINSGIAGNTTEDILSDMEHRVYAYDPSKVFLLIGINDLLLGEDADTIIENIQQILQKIQANCPQTQLYLESLYPVDPYRVGRKDNEEIKEINQRLKTYAQTNNIEFIDVYGSLVDEQDRLSKEYTDDGLHLNQRGYQIVSETLAPFLKD